MSFPALQRKPPQPSAPFLVGVGGWAYLPIKRGNNLAICSELYDFVEINSTFYKLPEIDRVRKWRATVADNFEFTIRANRELTHMGHLKPLPKNFKIFEQLLEIAKVLDARIIHFQFPPSFEVSKPVIQDWREFFASTSKTSRNLKFALEIRNGIQKSKGGDSETALQRLIGDYDLIPTTDPTRDEQVQASPSSKIVYSRVFGPGAHTRWSFDTQELKKLDDKLSEVKASKRYVTFHNLTMYEDASRMKTLVSTGRDLAQPPNSPSGLNSVKRALVSAADDFPATKQELINEYGWKTFNFEPGERRHVESLLNRLEERSYQSLDDVLETLHRTLPDKDEQQQQQQS